MMQIIRDLWFKRRDLISDGVTESLEYLSKIIPLKIYQYPSGTKCWTWKIPEKWSVGEAYIEDLEGNRILDLREHPLHIISYSLPINKVVTKEELLKHIHTDFKKSKAIPFSFKYYDRDWGFCIQHERLKDFIKEKYKVFIDSKFENDYLRIGEYFVKGKTDDTIVIVAHICHPAMANDSMSGVAVLVDVAKELSKRENYYTYRFLILPETIGSIAYLSQNERLIPKLKYGIFLEMLGNNTPLALQFTRQGNTKLDKVARYVMKKFPDGGKHAFRAIIGNDEIVFNGPGVNIPMISVSRFPHSEHHSSEDNIGIISEEKLQESKNFILEVLKIMEEDYIPIRTFKGPPFLSGHDLWFGWVDEKFSKFEVEQIMLRLEGEKSVFEIAEDVGIDFAATLNYVNKFAEKGLVIKKSII